MDDKEFYLFLLMIFVITLLALGFIGIPRIVEYMSIPVFHGDF